MNQVIYDIESDGLLYDTTTIHCIGIKVNEEDTKVYTSRPIQGSSGSILDALSIMGSADVLIGHNIIKFDNAVKYGIIEARNILGLPLTDEEEDILKNILYENDNALLEGYKKINLIDRLDLTNLQSRNNVILSEGTCIESIQKLPASTLIDKWIFVQRSHDLYAAGFSDLICYATIVKEMQFRCYVTSVQGAQFQHSLSGYAEITLVDKIPHYYYDNTKVNRRND